MERELRDELEVPGHVLKIESMTVVEIKKEVEEILSKYEKEGKHKLKEIPEGPDKRRLRELMRVLGTNVQF